MSIQLNCISKFKVPFVTDIWFASLPREAMFLHHILLTILSLHILLSDLVIIKICNSETNSQTKIQIKDLVPDQVESLKKIKQLKNY